LSLCGFILLAVVVGVIIKIGALWDMTFDLTHHAPRIAKCAIRLFTRQAPPTHGLTTAVPATQSFRRSF